MTFSLNWKTELELIKTSAKLTENRQFSEFARKALKVIPALMNGNIEPLFEVFPWVKESVFNLVAELVEQRVGEMKVQVEPIIMQPEPIRQLINESVEPKPNKLDLDLDEIIGRIFSESKQENKRDIQRLEYKLDNLAYLLENPNSLPQPESQRFDDMDDDLLNISDDPVRSGNSNENFIAGMASAWD
ncbi:MAG: hypothetical protein AAF846_27515 [Chloroflexota bacterium]